MTLQEPPSGPLRWSVGIGFAALLHVCGALILLRIPPPQAPAEPVMMLELAPLTQAPEEPPTPTPADTPAPPQPEAASEPQPAQPPPPEPKAAPEAPLPPPPEPQAAPEAPQPEAAPPEPPPVEPPPQELPPPEPYPSQPEIAVPEVPDLPTPPVPVAPPPRPVARPVPRKPVTVASPQPARPVQPAQPVTMPAPAAAAPPVAAPSAQALADWRSRLLAHLNRFKQYPAAALMRRIQGVAYVHLLLMPDGTVRDVRLQTSSGAALLDDEALALIARAVPMPSRPDSGPTELVVPIQFAVR